IVAEALLLVAFGEYASLARANGIQLPEAPAALGAVLTAATFSRTAFSVPWLSIDIVLLVSLIGLSIFAMVRWDGGSGALAFVSAWLFPCFYLGLPVGTIIYLRETAGYKALFLLVLTVAVSDSMQYFTGRAVGKHPLAPAISPQKTIEGAIGGFVFGGVFLA